MRLAIQTDFVGELNVFQGIRKFNSRQNKEEREYSGLHETPRRALKKASNPQSSDLKKKRTSFTYVIENGAIIRKA